MKERRWREGMRGAGEGGEREGVEGGSGEEGRKGEGGGHAIPPWFGLRQG